MKAWISLVKKQIELVDRFVLEMEITNSGFIEKELFMFRVDTDTFSHVAIVKELKEYPVVKQNELNFYRQAKMEMSFLTKALAIEGTEDLIRRLNLVINFWSYDQSTVQYEGVDYILIEAK